ncbi:MAG: histidinol dehydrogenase [Christensenellaceae bacterium]|nr:histidinol dehydrogenase [Christensenellaceae bacterium]
MIRIQGNDIETLKKRLLERGETDYSAQEAAVKEIIAAVKSRGDEALFAYTKKFDKFDVNTENFLVSEAEIEEAYANTDAQLIAVMRESAENIRAYHQLQKREDFELKKPGILLRQAVRPIARAGVYVPGGKASYPSSVLMNIIPAKVAGVGEIIMASPADKNGKLPALTLIAAKEAGADKIFKMGGAQAVAAMAYGTDLVPRVDKITGPGNIYVALAKKQVFGQVGIDMIAGPSEVLVIADKTSNPRFIAADFLSQAEHDELAACILVTDDAAMADAVEKEIWIQAEQLSKKETVFKSLENYGTIVITKDLAEAAAVSDRIAPEHLELCIDGFEALLPLIHNAGSIFLGQYSPEPLGDYFAGANHVLPTNGTARFSSPLSVDDFIKKSSHLYYDKEAFRAAYKKVQRFAEAEGLTAHARSASIRFEEEP